jgi:hypothetical protein
MDFKPEDFQHLKYNVYAVPQDKEIISVFSELSRFPEYSKESGLDANKVLRYIMYAYDRKSPLLAEKNLIKRKMLACKLSGFELAKDGKYPAEVESMIKGENQAVNRMIICFCRNQKSAQYSLLISGMESFYDNLSQLATPSDSHDKMKDMVDKAKLFEYTQKMISSLEINSDEVFNGDIQLMYEADEAEGEETGRIKSFPEYIAEKRDDGELDKVLA